MNDQNETQHLTDEQLDDFLLGERSPHAERHLAICPKCRAQVTAFEASLSVFNQASLAWAQAKSNTLTRELPAVKPRRSSYRPLAVSMGALAAGAMAFAAASHFSGHGPLVPAPQPASRYAVVQPSQDRTLEIASDNALLANIDEALDAPVASPSLLFDMRDPRNSTSR